ncbi:glycosyltransferase family 4 protein [Conidiobolus coronatus NRRL 28638]|uniref:Phosphatidylinositol N-acetylglucosaminyltransferase GPI3 subunit n=1 Tax=Conidiobolus coronatus (strain ATCC 28846 / CBS 209.66 / NRRL 28638) TaxID=796925 RepID=A0A137P6I8_CONC2|nr:glycosyltransferase family 4 protein [Conidiobolus coronatus NRRL 28638]|eukprot:KXN70627.1 glycosyltransferase family 4 protein [Conidiobolus coronatus NRRL 28638]
MERKKLNICIVSDFFFPNVGGVESHIYYLALQFVDLGHKVIIITHHYGDRKGVRYITNGIKVYYLPHFVIYAQATFPTLYGIFPIFRDICIREEIQIIHAHQAFAQLGLESIIHGRTLGLKTLFTDHSLFGFNDTNSIVFNKFLSFCLADIDHVICVSHACRENTVLRANLDPSIVSVIPNAVVPSHFTPDPSKREEGWITIVVLSRLVWRKGMDLLIAIIPAICKKYPKVKFLIGGDGEKMVELEQMREKNLLTNRVKLLGVVKTSQVRNTLVQGHIFLNTSLTEAFCIAVIEAACCGLKVVSTNVGGIPEVLPTDLIRFSNPDEQDLLDNLCIAIEEVINNEPPMDEFKQHEQVQSMYSWRNIAKRTEQVYYNILSTPQPTTVERFER